MNEPGDMSDPVPQAPGPAVRVFQLEDLRAALEGRAARPDAFDAELLHCFGPRGNGIVAVSGVPRAVELKRRLLALAPGLASMPLAQLKELMKKQGVGSDVSLKKADRLVTSLACQLPCQSAEVAQGPSGFSEERIQAATSPESSGALDGAPQTATDDMAQLGTLMRDLATELTDVTLLIAQLCDAALLRQLASRYQHPLTPSAPSGTSRNASLSGLPPTASQQRPNSSAAPEAGPTKRGDSKALGCGASREMSADDNCVSSGTCLAEAIRKGGTAKARLIHYHALRESTSQPPGTKSSAVSTSAHAGHPELPGQDGSPPCLLPPHRLWQQWHYDYGLFTALVAPTYRHDDAADGGPMDAPCSPGNGAQANTGSIPPAFSCRCSAEVCGSELAAPSEEGSCHQAVRAPQWGLHVLCRQCKRLLRVEVPPGCVAIQVGESAQILSGGQLCAPLHCVLRATSLGEGLSGSGPGSEDWSRQSFVAFVQPSWNRVLGHFMPEEECSLAHIVRDDHSENVLCQGEATRFGQSSVPSLRCRWQPGMTFSEFAKATTRAYYGAGGLQPHRT